MTLDEKDQVNVKTLGPYLEKARRMMKDMFKGFRQTTLEEFNKKDE